MLDAGGQPVEQMRLGAGETTEKNSEMPSAADGLTFPARTAPSDTSRRSWGVPTSTFGRS